MKNSIERSIWIAASPQAVWDALVDAGAFSTWFGASAEGPFEMDRAVWLVMNHGVSAGVRFWIRPALFEVPRRFAFHWPAGDAPTDDDPARSQTTRVTFDLAEENGGTRVTVTEAGFADLPAEIAERKYPDNVQGWEFQLGNIKAHVET